MKPGVGCLQKRRRAPVAESADQPV